MSHEMDWQWKAACQDIEDPEIFFPVGQYGQPAPEWRIEETKRICRRCPVAEECLKWALDTNQRYGIWGGMSEIERQALKRRSSSQPTNTRPTPHTQKDKPPYGLRESRDVGQSLRDSFSPGELEQLLEELS